MSFKSARRVRGFSTAGAGVRWLRILGIEYDDYERMTASARRRAKGILYAEFGNHLHPEPSGCIVQDST